MKLHRRDFLLGALGFGIGGALATTTGLSYYYLKRPPPSVTSSLKDISGYIDGVEEWVLTAADYDGIAALDGLPESRTLELLDNTDIPGAGDIREERVSSIEECVSACEADDSCNAFTFARVSHPITKKRHMCWIKSERNPQNLVSSPHYISGRKP